MTHVDLDGLYAAAKWILDGNEPYRGADDDARAVDTRVGMPGPIATRIDRALRAKFRDDQLKRAVVHFLVGGMKPGPHDDVIAEAAAEFERRDARTQELAQRFTIRGRVAVVDTAGAAGPVRQDRPVAGGAGEGAGLDRARLRDADDRGARSTRAGTSSRCSSSAAACRRA